MSELITSLAPILKSVIGIGGTASGLFESYKQQQYQNKLRSLAENPQKMAQYARGFTQPLNAGLEKSAANEAQAYAAERGLATSPAASEQILSQILAPYIQQNQQQGYSNALQALGLGGGASPSDPSKSLMSGLEQLQQLPFLQPKPQGGPFDAPQLPNFDPATGAVFTPDYFGSNYGLPGDFSFGTQS